MTLKSYLQATINKATTTDTVTYYWNAFSEVFVPCESRWAHMQKITHIIIVDAGLTAQELDAIFAEIL